MQEKPILNKYNNFRILILSNAKFNRYLKCFVKIKLQIGYGNCLRKKGSSLVKTGAWILDFSNAVQKT